MTKICSNCKLEKPFEDYPPSKGIPHGHSRCRSCKQEYDRQYHKRRPAAAKQQKQNLQYARVLKLKQLLWNFKLENPCIDCGETDPIVLELDHNDSTTKESDVCSLVRAGASWIRIKAEIEKCVVRCANCHRRRTHKQFGWFSGSEEES